MEVAVAKACMKLKRTVGFLMGKLRAFPLLHATSVVSSDGIIAGIFRIGSAYLLMFENSIPVPNF